MWANLNGTPVSVTSLITTLVGLDMLGLADKEVVAFLVIVVCSLIWIETSCSEEDLVS